jgi:cytochrome P450
MAAANRDPAVYEQPDQFRLDRRKNHHHTLGFGIHFCIGAPLARMEARLTLRALLKRFGTLSRPEHPPGENERVASPLLRGFHHLWIQLD